MTSVVVRGWTILGHPLFLEAMEKLLVAVEAEKMSNAGSAPSGNAKLLARLLDLAFVRIPEDPGNRTYRHGGTLEDRRHWFRGKTGGGRYRLFYRFDSRAKIIVYAWVNDEHSLRTYQSKSDAYVVFARMLDNGNPPDQWDTLVAEANQRGNQERLERLTSRPDSPSPDHL